MDINWDDARTFLAIADAGSVSAGAKRMGLGQPTVSRRLALLEARLGCALFVRGKQGVELTEAGGRLKPSAEQMARWASEFERQAQGAEEKPEGTLRIAAPPGIAVDLLSPLAATLRPLYPALRIEVRASVPHLDLTRGEADLAIRMRPPSEPELMSLAEGRSEIGVFATRGYAKVLAERFPERPAAPTYAFDEIDWITWSPPLDQVAPRPMLERAIPNFQPIFASDDYLVLRAATAQGLGAMVLDRTSARQAFSEPLVEINLGISMPANSFHLVCAKSMQFVPRVQVVAKHLTETLFVA